MAQRRAHVFWTPCPHWAAPGIILAAAVGVLGAQAETPCNRTLGPATVQAFLDHPPGLLESAVMSDSTALADRVRRLSFHGDAAIGAISRIIALARGDQRKAIAVGFAHAATECRAVHPAISRSIATAANRVSDVGFRAAFLDTMREGDAPPPPADAHQDDAPSGGKALPRLAPGSKTDLPPLGDPFRPLDPVKDPAH